MSSAGVKGAEGGGPSEELRDRDKGDGEQEREIQVAEEPSTEEFRHADDGAADEAGAAHAAALEGEGEGGGEGRGGARGREGGGDSKQKKFALSPKTDALRKMLEQRRHDFNKAKAEKMKEEQKRYMNWVQGSSSRRNSIASPVSGPSSPAAASAAGHKGRSHPSAGTNKRGGVGSVAATTPSSSSFSSSPAEGLVVNVASPEDCGGDGGAAKYLSSGSATPNIATPPSQVSLTSPSSLGLHLAAAARGGMGVGSPGSDGRSQKSSTTNLMGSGSPGHKVRAGGDRRRSVLMVHADNVREKLEKQMEEMDADCQKRAEEKRKVDALKAAKGGTWQVDSLPADSDSSYQGYLQAVVEAAAIKCEKIKECT